MGKKNKRKSRQIQKSKTQSSVKLNFTIFLNKHTVIAGLIVSVVVVSFEKWKWSIVQVLSLVKIFTFNIK